MTTEELRELAAKVATVPIDDLPEFVSEVYNAIAAVHNDLVLNEIKEVLIGEGVDVDGLCRKKHPS